MRRPAPANTTINLAFIGTSHMFPGRTAPASAAAACRGHYTPVTDARGIGGGIGAPSVFTGAAGRRRMRALSIVLRTFLPLVTLLALSIPAPAKTNFSGVWAERIHEDSYERSGGPPLGDYQGIPLNDAGRMKADSHDHSEWSLPEF